MLKNEINTPANIRQIAAIAAEIRGVAVEEITEATERNVEMLLAAEKVVWKHSILSESCFQTTLGCESWW